MQEGFNAPTEESRVSFGGLSREMQTFFSHFAGVGYCAVMVAFYVSFYYTVIIAWAFYFLFASLQPELPWTRCDASWNTPSCFSYAQKSSKNTSSEGDEELRANFDVSTSPAFEYFARGVLGLHRSTGISDLGWPRWTLLGCLLIVYSLLYLSLFKGVKASGKVVWVTATMPYFILSILLFRGLFLPGASQGIIYYLSPDLSRLKHSQVWVDAAVQIFYSVGAGFGVHLTYASYNTFHNNCYR
ncbi:unnamed protein product [Darwinula stevensoni]|uniref:Uncharacterized protein n=1 Tax=Darwinula stevensoni TaxID=69355 RepID=A0A7R9A2S3_9CRUS|nr:unnamed protein product [Darwinula stevensoni]CAG0889253.1 unnamed protein product [Darwinula stevensoni]